MNCAACEGSSVRHATNCIYARRFWAKVRKSDQCWIWTACNTRGYGVFWVKGKKVVATRFVWTLTHGKEVPPDLVVMHSCDNPTCVNPSHLSLGTHADNVADKVNKGRQSGPSRKTHCLRGHPLVEGNLYFTPRGRGQRRECKTCSAMRTAESNAKRAEVRQSRQFDRAPSDLRLYP